VLNLRSVFFILYFAYHAPRCVLHDEGNVLGHLQVRLHYKLRRNKPGCYQVAATTFPENLHSSTRLLLTKASSQIRESQGPGLGLGSYSTNNMTWEKDHDMHSKYIHEDGPKVYPLWTICRGSRENNSNEIRSKDSEARHDVDSDIPIQLTTYQKVES